MGETKAAFFRLHSRPFVELLGGDFVVIRGLVVQLHAVQRVTQRLLRARVQHLRLGLAGIGDPRDEEDLAHLATVLGHAVPVEDEVPGLVRGELVEELLELEAGLVGRRRSGGLGAGEVGAG